MNSLYRGLSERIRGELTDLERLLPRIERAWKQAHWMPEEFAFLDSVAFNLHSLYSGLERLFELIAWRVDENMPDGKTWHRDLLIQMSRELPDIRPAVIGEDSFRYLDELRRFRHLVRNVYAMNLSAIKMKRLVDRLFVSWPQLHSELLAFAEFLDLLAQAEEHDHS